FNAPEARAARGEPLSGADRRNHLIRALDLKAKTVKTIAGTGEQNRYGRKRGGKALTIGLNSPWDLYVNGNNLYIAQAGHHQIWLLDLKQKRIEPYAGDGMEKRIDGPVDDSSFAQPSGLTSDGKYLYVADSETSSIRKLPLFSGKGEVSTIVGQDLFEFGDVDGVGDNVRLQHALGVAYRDGKLFV